MFDRSRFRSVILGSLAAVAVILIFFGAQWAIIRWQDAHTPDQKPAAVSSADQLIQNLSDRLMSHPDDISTAVALSGAYLQKVRETADAAFYSNIDALMAHADTVSPGNPEVLRTQALVAAGRHNFVRARELINQAIHTTPHRPAYYGVLADAEIELGHYPAAEEALQTMVDIRPDFNSYSRIALFRELHGDIAGAADALQLAISAGGAFPENIAWVYVELGKLALRDELKKAQTYFEQANAVLPNFPPALEGLGRVALARDDAASARDLFQRAFDQLPIAQYATDLGDTYTRLGDKAKAEQQYFLATLAYDTSAKSGVNTDLEVALFLADHDLELPKALEKARAGYAVRGSIHGADVLAWALYKNGDITNATRYVNEALRLGEYDAVTLFHAGMIASARHDTKEAKRLLEKAVKLHTLPVLSLDVVKAKLQSL